MTKPTVTDFLSVLFSPGDFTCYAKKASGTTVFPVERPPHWVQFFSLNALDGTTDHEVVEEYHAADRPRRADANVVCLRNILLEIDGMPLDQQRPYLDASGIPWSTCVFSGSKSYHFVISVETPFRDRDEYDRVVGWIHNILSEIDHSTKNPSRLTRFPNVVRVDKGLLQELIEVRGRVRNADLYKFLERFPEAEPAPDIPLSESVLPEGEKGFLSKRTRQFLMFGADHGHQNTELHQAARDMLQNGWTAEEATPLLYDALKNYPDFDEKKFRSTVRSAFSKPPQFPPRVSQGKPT